ncbi:hypothetical protein J4E82_011504 [Alternaria postmessia]|uniref:uncharacterized protein n=1 Tax=Alternaria postmessia TaxID=1187938 RepID=UPI002224444B|nr:uncharacterized protein J4E82_011504 [Alternaria postmessia]KAI5364385.1 hypothetical protein J4E82_011504 [Alternaria postmessia]
MKRRRFQCNRTLINIASKLILLDIPTPEPTPSRPSTSHDRHTFKDGICNQSPWINRRILDELTERELYLACRHVLLHSKLSDHGVRNTGSKLDCDGSGRQKNRMTQACETSVHMPISVLAELSSTSSIGRGPNIKTRTRPKANMEARARSYGEMSTCANSNGKRAAFGQFDDRDAQKQGKLRMRDSFPDCVPQWTNRCDEDVTLPMIVDTIARGILPTEPKTQAEIGEISSLKATFIDSMSKKDKKDN